MNIGVNARFLNSEILEGMGRYTFEILSRMVASHPNDTFYFFFDRPYLDKYVLGPNVIPIVVTPAARHPFLFYYWFEHRLVSAANKYSLDVFYSADNFLSLKLKVPTALVVHDLAYMHYPQHIPWLARSYYRIFMPKFIKKASHVITVSEYVKSDVIQSSKIEADRVSVIYNALPERTQMANELVDRIKGPYFVFVGSVNQRKNIKKALLAFEKVRGSSNLRFVLIGKKYNLDSDTEKIFDRLLKNGSLIHLKGIKDDELMSILANAKAMVYVSFFEGFGIPLLEAMAAGIPIITSNVTSMPEVIDEAGLTVNPNNVDDIAEAMTRLYSDEELCQELVSKGKTRMAQFSWERSAVQTYDVLQSLAVNTQA